MRLARVLLLLAAPVVALASGLHDDHLAWMAPPMAVQEGDRQRTSGHMHAAATAIRSHGAVDAATRTAAATP